MLKYLDDNVDKAQQRRAAAWPNGCLKGCAHQVVPPEVAGRWLEAVLAVDWKKVEPAAFAATQLARLTGDRSRDLPDDLRESVLARLRALNASATWIEQIGRVVELDKADERRAFGESLPAGLWLLPEGGTGQRQGTVPNNGINIVSAV